MSEKKEREAEHKKAAAMKRAIMVLAVLLVLSVCGLAAQYIYQQFFAPTQATVSVPDNLIGEEEGESAETKPSAEPADKSSGGESGVQPARPSAGAKAQAVQLELYEGKPGDNERFEVGNMLPGDTETKYYCLKVNHKKEMALYFKADITEQTKNLGEVLHIKVTHLETGRVICDAAFAEINGQALSELLEKNAAGETIAYYQIDVSLDTAVGNEYQAAELRADFEWYVQDEGGLTPPDTGDRSMVILWVVMALSSLALMILLLLKRRKGDERHG